MKFTSVFLVLAASAAVLGCSSRTPQAPNVATAEAKNGTTTATTPIADPCTLATVDEASVVMGRKSKPGEFKKALKGNRCDFHDASYEYDVFLQTVDWNYVAQAMTPENTVPGIGEKAFWSYGSVYVLKNGHGMMIGFQLPNVIPALTPPARKFAETVVSRM